MLQSKMSKPQTYTASWSCVITRIPYSGKDWRVESLANRLQFAKLKSSKEVVAINTLWLIYSSPNFFAKCLKIVNSPDILSAKPSCYTVHSIQDITNTIMVTAILYHMMIMM